MTIRRLIQTGAALLAAILVVAGFVAYTSIQTIRIGGDIHQDMVLDQELMADIMPPPLFVVESFMLTGEILAQGGRNTALIDDLRAQHRTYNQRISFWQKSGISPQISAAIEELTHKSGAVFWQEIDSNFIPAAHRGDVAAMQASYARLTPVFEQHRSDVLKLVTVIEKNIAADRETSDGRLSLALWMLAIAGVVISGAVGYSAWQLLARVVRPMGELVSVTNELAAGANRPVPHRDRPDELGELSRAVDTFRQAAEDRAASDAKAKEEQLLVTHALDASLAALKDGDLTHDITEQFPPAFRQLRDNFNEAVAGIRDLMRQVGVSTTSILTGAEEISTAANTLARRTESNAASLEETNAALGGVDTRVRTTAAATQTTLKQAVEAQTRVELGRSRAGGAMAAMNEVSETTKGIDSVIEGLDKIAFQTRVLAMNAAVEAGRAGEAGRGFAVVADLVSALAMRAEEEARLAREQLTVTQSGIFTAVEAVKEVDASLMTISATVDEFNRMLAGIAADNEVQSSALGEISSAVAAMDSATQENAAMVEQTSAATTSLAAEVEKLSAQAQRFRVDGGATRHGSAAALPGRRADGRAPASAPRTPAWQGSSGLGHRQAAANSHQSA